MKRMAMATVLALCSTAALAADALRTDKHLVKIETQAVAQGSRQYNVQVFDAESRQNVAHLKVVTRGDTAAQAETAAGGAQYTVRVEPYGMSYMVAFTAANGTEVVDSMRAGFSLAPKSKPPVPQRKRTGREIDAPVAIRRVDALYTEEAKAAGAAGTVIVEVVIGRSGFVQEATVVKPMGYGLSESAVDAVKQWQFAPSMQGRMPVEVLHEVTVEFKP